MRFLRIGIYTLVVFAVLAHGAVEDWARAVLVIGSSFLFLAWAVYAYLQNEEKFFLSPLLLPLFVLALIVLGQWAFHATASAYHTKLELQLLLAYLLLLFLTVQAFRSIDDWRTFAWFIMILGFAVSTFGVLQHLTFNGKLYWIREMRYGGIPFGPYANRNHFAGFAELVIPMALVPMALGKVRRERWFVVGLFAIMPIVALIMSASRGGIIAVGVQVIFLAVWMAFRRTAGKQLLAGGALLLVVLLMVSWLGVRKTLDRFASLQTLEASQSKRTSMRQDTWRMFLDHPWTGTGLGTLQTVFPKYETNYDGKIVNHTHNDYLEALAETGVAGAACCAWFLGVLFLEGWKRLRSPDNSFVAILHFSALAACVGFLVHSFGDFNLHIPANALLFFLMAHLATIEIRKVTQPPPISARRRHHHRRNH
ncbi:MAG TPA: O-antigen ligase family protein [Candidatus Saccharimonadales bacterium]|nr:O-antigen ligase family protein [Candidatus Saccharimonadales bacterium]